MELIADKVFLNGLSVANAAYFVNQKGGKKKRKRHNVS